MAASFTSNQSCRVTYWHKASEARSSGVCATSHGVAHTSHITFNIAAFNAPRNSQVTEHRSPTGEYQRGPPTHSVTDAVRDDRLVASFDERTQRSSRGGGWSERNAPRRISPRCPAYSLVNLNVHYDREINDAYLRGLVLFFEVKNVLTGPISLPPITSQTASMRSRERKIPEACPAIAGTGSIYAGAPRSFIGGLKLAFR